MIKKDISTGIFLGVRKKSPGHKYLPVTYIY